MTSLATSLASKIVKWAMIGGGTILSLLPGGAPVGVPLIIAGTQVPTNEGNDVVSQAAINLQPALDAYNYGISGGTYNITLMDKILLWIKNNMVLTIIAAGILFTIIFKPFKHRRR
jgi:hypothetical protein